MSVSLQTVFFIALSIAALPLQSSARSCDDLFSYQETLRLDLSGKSLDELVTIFNETHNAILNCCVSANRVHDTVRDFYDNQLDQVRSALLKVPASQRLAYLRDKSNDLPDRSVISLFGIDTQTVNKAIEARIGKDNGLSTYGDEILYLRGSGVWETPPWVLEYILRDQMQPQTGQTVMDLGSGFGLMGMFIGLWYPNVKFIGYEILPERVDEANRVAIENGFTNVEFRTANLAELPELPIADHIYMYSPFNAETGNKVGLKLRDLSDIHDITVYINYGFQSASFSKYFKPRSRGERIYVRRQTPRL